MNQYQVISLASDFSLKIERIESEFVHLFSSTNLGIKSDIEEENAANQTGDDYGNSSS